MQAMEFILELCETGRVSVAQPPDMPEKMGDAVLALDQLVRPTLAFDPPGLIPEAGEWAFVVLYQACQALVYREMEADVVRGIFKARPPRAAGPGVCYAADLLLRCLPELIGLARGIAADDPLVEGLMGLARDWPLSSVGVREVGKVDIGRFMRDRSLRRLYADRIIQRGDVGRMDDPAAREAVREALGAHAELAPAVARALEERKA
jgi:hypothetical protein